MLLKKVKWLVVGYSKSNKKNDFLYDGNSFNSEESATEYLLKKQLENKECTWETVRREYPRIPYIREASTYNSIMYDARYEVVSTSGSIDLVKSLGDALKTWTWLVCPKLVFLAYRVKDTIAKKLAEQNSENSSATDANSL